MKWYWRLENEQRERRELCKRVRNFRADRLLENTLIVRLMTAWVRKMLLSPVNKVRQDQHTFPQYHGIDRCRTWRRNRLYRLPEAFLPSPIFCRYCECCHDSQRIVANLSCDLVGKQAHRDFSSIRKPVISGWQLGFILCHFVHSKCALIGAGQRGSRSGHAKQKRNPRRRCLQWVAFNTLGHSHAHRETSGPDAKAAFKRYKRPFV